MQSYLRIELNFFNLRGKYSLIHQRIDYVSKSDGWTQDWSWGEKSKIGEKFQQTKNLFDILNVSFYISNATTEHWLRCIAFIIPIVNKPLHPISTRRKFQKKSSISTETIRYLHLRNKIWIEKKKKISERRYIKL